MFKPKFNVYDTTEKRIKRVVMLEWNMDNPDELIEVHTYPIAIYKGGYRLKQDDRHEKHKRSIDELIFTEPKDLLVNPNQPFGKAQGKPLKER